MRVEPDNTAEPGWSPARVELLRMHYALGLSAAVSARLIGEVTRNAVISKRRRLGLMGANPLQAARRAAWRGGSTPDRSPSPFSRYASCFWSVEDEAVTRREPLPFMDWPAPARADPKTLAERAAGECAWPLGPAEAVGDYRTLFCCAPAQEGRSYCAVHRTRASGGLSWPPIRPVGRPH